MTPQDASAERISRSSVTVTRNTKGFSFEAKVYAGDTDMRAALDALYSTVAELEARFPRGEA